SHPHVSYLNKKIMIQNQSTTFWRQSGEKRVLLLVSLDQYSVHLININIKPISCQHRPVQGLCQPFLGALITPVNPALYFCTLLRLPRDIRRLVSYSSGFVLQTKNQTG